DREIAARSFITLLVYKEFIYFSQSAQNYRDTKFYFKLECCGINGPGDWKNNSLAIPPSCCDGQVITGGAAPPCTPDSTGFHKEGCLTKLVTHLQQLSKVLGGVGLGIAFIQLLGVIFACCLARSIRSQYETV
ncbi:Tetraspanin 39D, partial [Operophtera brumata]